MKRLCFLFMGETRANRIVFSLPQTFSDSNSTITRFFRFVKQGAVYYIERDCISSTESETFPKFEIVNNFLFILKEANFDKMFKGIGKMFIKKPWLFNC
jgi:hypothetical protein